MDRPFYLSRGLHCTTPNISPFPLQFRRFPTNCQRCRGAHLATIQAWCAMHPLFVPVLLSGAVSRAISLTHNHPQHLLRGTSIEIATLPVIAKNE